MTPDPHQLLSLLLESKSKLPNLNDMAFEMMRQFGGYKEFAKEYFTQYKACKANKASAARMLGDMMRLLQLANEATVDDPIEGMSNEELKAIMAEVMKQITPNGATQKETKAAAPRTAG